MTRLDARSLCRWVAAGATLMALATVPILAETVVLERLSSAGKKALAAERFDEAQEIFQKGVLVAKEEGEADWFIRMSFYLGLGYQAQAEAEGNDPAQLERAARLYHGVLESKPNSGSTMVNLAQVYGKLEMGGRAHTLFKRAIDLGDENRALYESKYAEYLAESGDSKGAAAFYQLAAESEPKSASAHKALLEAYLDPGMGEEPLLEYLWQQVDSGEVLRAEDGALRALEGGWPEGSRIELLTVVVASLARRFEDPKSLRASATWQRLQALAGDTAIGTGVEELLQLYTEPGNYPSDAFRWWSEQGDSESSPKRGVWPREAFQELMRRVGSWFEQRGDWKVAESCYETAAVLATGELDPRSIRSLADMYVRQGRTDKVHDLANTYKFELFRGKGQAYRHSQAEKIYEYHRTLGEIYGYLARQTGDWGDSGTVASAVFQLERAKRFGEQLEQESGDKVYVDPGLVSLLAVAYDGTNRKDDKKELVLGAAETYQARGDLKARDRVLRQVEAESLETGDRERYLILQRETVAPVTRQDETELMEAGETENSGGEENQRQLQPNRTPR